MNRVPAAPESATKAAPMSSDATEPLLSEWGLARLIVGHISLHACMAGMRMAAPLLALSEGYSPLAKVAPIVKTIFQSI